MPPRQRPTLLAVTESPAEKLGRPLEFVLADGALPTRVEVASLPDGDQVHVRVGDAEALDSDAGARPSRV